MPDVGQTFTEKRQQLVGRLKPEFTTGIDLFYPSDEMPSLGLALPAKP
jgi:hypothetical protein